MPFDTNEYFIPFLSSVPYAAVVVSQIFGHQASSTNDPL
jgi:hypothetical protein